LTSWLRRQAATPRGGASDFSWDSALGTDRWRARQAFFLPSANPAGRSTTASSHSHGAVAVRPDCQGVPCAPDSTDSCAVHDCVRRARVGASTPRESASRLAGEQDLFPGRSTPNEEPEPEIPLKAFFKIGEAEMKNERMTRSGSSCLRAGGRADLNQIRVNR